MNIMSFDPALLSIVEAHFPGASLRSATPLAGGVSADVRKLEIEQSDGRVARLVLRIHGATHNGHPAALEFETLRALSQMGVPVPRPLAYDDTGRIIAHPYLLLDFVDGAAQIPVDAIDVGIATAAEVLATIHRVPMTPLPTLPLRIDPMPELLAYLMADPDWASLRLHLLRRNPVAFGANPVLLHGDFWPGNWVWQGRQLAGVLDWEDAAIGDPLSDVACTWLELRYLYGSGGADLFVQTYARHGVLDGERLALWQLYVAAAALHHMGHWGLEAGREAAMRATARLSIAEVAERLAG